MSFVHHAVRCLSVVSVVILVGTLSFAEGFVDVDLSWRPSAQTYTYVFAGRVLCKNHPCSEARVEIRLVKGDSDGPAQEVVPDENGFYKTELAMAGSANESMQWMLSASQPSPSEDRQAEATGRVILMEDRPRMTIARSFSL